MFVTFHRVLDVARPATKSQPQTERKQLCHLSFVRQRDGRLRDIWFGAFEINGSRYGINLGVKIAGTPPASLSLREKATPNMRFAHGGAGKAG